MNPWHALGTIALGAGITIFFCGGIFGIGVMIGYMTRWLQESKLKIVPIDEGE